MATRIIFVRHGLTNENARREIQGSQPTELAISGRTQAVAAANALKAYSPTALYSSAYVRARQTADIISKELGLHVRENTRLREQGFGEWEGRSWTEITGSAPAIVERSQNEGWWFCPPGGEPRLRVRHRMLAFIDEVRQEHPDTTTVAVSHRGAIYLMVHALLDKTPTGRASLQFSNGGFTIVEAGDGRVMLVTVNEIQHLQRLQED